MGKVVGGITMSMDGFVAGPNDRLGAGLGDGGERLHYWVFGGPWRYGEEGGSATRRRQALHRGRRSRPAAPGSSAGRCTTSSTAGATTRASASRCSWSRTGRTRRSSRVTRRSSSSPTGSTSALDKARAAAGDKNVIVMGGADLLRQYLAAGVVDELTLTIAPVLLGAGTRLFDGIERTDLGFERTAVIESPYATHLRYEVRV